MFIEEIQEMNELTRKLLIQHIDYVFVDTYGGVEIKMDD